MAHRKTTRQQRLETIIVGILLCFSLGLLGFLVWEALPEPPEPSEPHPCLSLAHDQVRVGECLRNN